MQEKVYNGLRYLVRYPEGFDARQKYPVLIFLHGAGTIGNDIRKLAENSFWGHIDRPDFPCVTFAPQCDEGMVWFDLLERLRGFAQMISELEFADPSRLYLTGNSMGGYGTWQLAMSMPKLFAAILPVCGGGMYWNAGRLKSMPVWAFHGEDDKVVFCEESRKMVNAINARGGNAKLTTYAQTGHNAWDPTYSNPETWEWLLAQRRSDENDGKSGESYSGKQFG